jgi:hypothetical protein
MTTTAKDLLEPVEVLTKDTIAGLRVTKPAAEGYINMIIYGDPGAGKTRLAGSACVIPNMSPVLLLDWEGGTLSLADDYDAVEVLRPTTWKQVDQIYGALYDNNPYRTVIVDSLTEAQKFCMQQIMRDVVEANPSRDRDIASLREWGKQGEQLRRLVRALRDLPCNTIFTALCNEEKDDSGKLIKRRPALPGQLKGEIAGYVDIVGYLYQKEFVRGPDREMKTLFLTEMTEKELAKDRTGKLPPVMEAPTMQDIHGYMNGETTK